MFTDQNCLNRIETVYGTIRFLFLLSPIVSVKIFIMSRCMSKSYTTTKNTNDRQYTERRQL